MPKIVVCVTQARYVKCTIPFPGGGGGGVKGLGCETTQQWWFQAFKMYGFRVILSFVMYYMYHMCHPYLHQKCITIITFFGDMVTAVPDPFSILS